MIYRYLSMPFGYTCTFKEDFDGKIFIKMTGNLYELL